MAPDFTALFHGPTDEDWDLEPRQAYALHGMLAFIGDGIRSEVDWIAKGLSTTEDCVWLSYLPRIAHGEGLPFYRRVASSALALYADLEKGERPQPRNTAEEIILYVALTHSASWIEDESSADEKFNALPEMSDEFDVDELMEYLCQDTDFLHLFDPAMDGIEDPANVPAGMGRSDQRPAAWFDWFGNVEPRDESRYFLAEAIYVKQEEIAPLQAVLDQYEVDCKKANAPGPRGGYVRRPQPDVPMIGSLRKGLLEAELKGLKHAWEIVTGKPWSRVE